SSSRSAGCSRPSAAPRSSASSASPSPSPRPGARRDHSRLLAASARPGAPDRGGPDRVRRGRWRLDGTLQARADAGGPAGDARAPGDARARRRARRGRARARRGAREVRRRPAPLPPARGGHGTRHHRHGHRRGDARRLARLAPAHHRPSHGRRGRLSSRLPALERAHPLLRTRQGEDDRGMARVDPVRRRDDRRPLVARRPRRVADDAEGARVIGRVGARVAAGSLFAALARHLAREAARQTADPTRSREARTAIGARFLEAIWRYYNLVDFAVARRDDKTSVAIRLAFDEATGYATSTAAPDRLREPLSRIAHVLSTLIESSTPARRGS